MTDYPNKGGRFYRDPDTGVISDTPPSPPAPAEVKTPPRIKSASPSTAEEPKEA